MHGGHCSAAVNGKMKQICEWQDILQDPLFIDAIATLKLDALLTTFVALTHLKGLMVVIRNA